MKDDYQEEMETNVFTCMQYKQYSKEDPVMYSKACGVHLHIDVTSCTSLS